MALQPASGVRDLNPQQVQRNQELRETLAGVFRLWGFEEVTHRGSSAWTRSRLEVPLTAETLFDWWRMNRWGCDRIDGIHRQSSLHRLQDRHRPLRLGVAEQSLSQEWPMKAASASRKFSIAALSCSVVLALKRSWN